MIYSLLVCLIFLSLVVADPHPTHRKIPLSVQSFIAEKGLKEDHHFASAALIPDVPPVPSNINPTPASLISAILTQQTLADTSYIPLIRNEVKGGIWPSFIHLNLYGIWPLPEIRRGVGFLDNNAFVAEWLLEMLMEADDLQPLDSSIFKSSKYSDFSSFLKYTIQSLFPAFVNKNAGQYFPGSGFDSAFLFWEQTKNINGTMVCYPTNFADPLSLVVGNSDPNPLLEWLANIIGVTINDMHIPADFDDTAAASQVYLYIKEAAKKNPTKYRAAFEAINQAFFSSTSVDGTNALAKKLFTLLDRYAYKPFSNDKDANTIDPRTYYWMRNFLRTAPNDSTFITTWLQTRGGNSKAPLYGPNLPGLINDLDGGVMANAFFMLLSIVPQITDNTLFTPEIISLLQSSDSLLSYLVDSKMFETRGDLILKYYPSVLQFLYFVGRSAHAINSNPSFPPSLSSLGKKVQTSMQNAGIDWLLKKMKSNNACKDSLPKGKVTTAVNCFDDFLGNADRNIFNIPTPHYEDRIATTALAANAMMDTFTSLIYSSTGPSTLAWIPNTPSVVKSAIAGCVNFLKQAITVSNRPLENAFFSGFAKDENDFTYFYPFNTATFRNGTAIPADAEPPTKVSQYSLGVSGMIDENVYQQMIANKPFGHITPQGNWLGNNVNSTRLIYWSSPAISLAVTNLALTKAEKLTF